MKEAAKRCTEMGWPVGPTQRNYEKDRFCFIDRVVWMYVEGIDHGLIFIEHSKGDAEAGA